MPGPKPPNSIGPMMLPLPCPFKLSTWSTIWLAIVLEDVPSHFYIGNGNVCCITRLGPSCTTILCKSVSLRPSVLQIIPFFAFCGKCFHRFMEYVSHLGALSQTFFCSWVRLCIKIESSWNISYEGPTHSCLEWARTFLILVRGSHAEGLFWEFVSQKIQRAPRCAVLVRAPRYAVLVRAPRCAGFLVRALRCSSFCKSPAMWQFW